MSQPPPNSAPPPSVKPFNRRLVAQGRALPPAGGMRVASRSHLVRQERLGAALALLVLYGVVYGYRLVLSGLPPGVARGDFLTPLYIVGVFAAVLAAWSWWGARQRLGRRRRREVRYPPTPQQAASQQGAPE